MLTKSKLVRLPQFAVIDEPYRFHEGYDHNGGRSPFAIIAVRVNRLPAGTRDFEWEPVRDPFVSDEKIVFFGALKSPSAG